MRGLKVLNLTWGYKKAQAVYLPTLLFLILGLYYSPG